MSVYETAARFIEEHGETMVLSRSGETGLAVKGKRYANGTEDLGNSATQQVFRVKIGTTELAGSAWSIKAPKNGDRLTVDSRARTVRDVLPLKDGDVVALYELEVAG